ncbi:hypothetical protein L1267_12150 [Pseudoalteromonas sp. OFAV1]|uniref:hypothetical protein n=1 Tax=Pseudoalteromonas sp. OFAV1 TaxID=2908892 RepID=UPI001F26F309|nr:hypothetical protein [Pseudoalteromonas sp. OFAV1]MCF2901143.1 hypothetical protein [Pseudoalteromonas sp. OFAV1]
MSKSILARIKPSFVNYPLVTSEVALALSKGLLNNTLSFGIEPVKNDDLLQRFALTSNGMLIAEEQTYSAAAQIIIELANNVDYSVLEVVEEHDSEIDVKGKSDFYVLSMQYAENDNVIGFIIKDCNYKPVASLEIEDWDPNNGKLLLSEFKKSLLAEFELSADQTFSFFSERNVKIGINIDHDCQSLTLLVDDKQFYTMGHDEIDEKFLLLLKAIETEL